MPCIFDEGNQPKLAVNRWQPFPRLRRHTECAYYYASNHIHPAARFALLLHAVLADAADDQSMSRYAEALFAGDTVAQFDQFIALKLKELVAVDTVHVIVLRIAIIVFVNGATVEHEAAQQAGIDKLVERAIHGRTADVSWFAARWQLFDQGVGVEMLVAAEYVFNQKFALLGHAHAAALQILFETLLRGHRDFQPLKGLGGRHVLAF